ncbi:unnamed protein product [Mycena citricolor]|uniref:Uncharacterized protein n=1 Tax=Mycena citricolor TaxID=2018698 RepID=A0AAD2GRW4_9AGAR|nr:unnamed protein product [Mycena citricolor]
MLLSSSSSSSTGIGSMADRVGLGAGGSIASSSASGRTGVAATRVTFGEEENAVMGSSIDIVVPSGGLLHRSCQSFNTMTARETYWSVWKNCLKVLLVPGIEVCSAA